MGRTRRLFVFRIVLLAYPPSFRKRNGEHILAAIAAELDDGGSAAHGRSTLVVRLALVADLLRGALGEWRRAWLAERSGPGGRLLQPAQRLAMHGRIAARALRRTPSFTVVAVLTIALGVAVSTAVFSLVDGVLRRPMPYDQPEELVFVWNRFGSWGIPRAWVSGPQIAYLRENVEGFDGFAALTQRGAELDLGTGGASTVAMASVGEVSGALFDLLGVEAGLGRALRSEEEGPDAPRVAVLGNGIWRSLFDADPAAVGRTVRLAGVPHLIVGVMPPGFRFAIHAMSGAPDYPDIWVPMRRDLAAEPPGNNSFSLLARLADGVSMQQGSGRLAAAASAYGRDRADYVGDDFGSFLVPLRGDLTGDVRPHLLLIGAAVSLLMLLVCANLTTLYVGRGIDAEQQTALCAALGAGAWARAEVRLLEALLVTFIGGLLGVAACGWTMSALLSVAPAQLPRAGEVRIDGRVLGFGIVLTLVLGMAIALLPWLRERRTDIATALRSGGRSIAGSARTAQRLLVVIQIALAATLLFSAALIGRSLMALTDVDPGFRTDGVLLATVRAPAHLIEDDREAVLALQQLRERIAARPDVVDAGYGEFLPLSTGGDQNGFSFAGAPGASGRAEDDDVVADHISVGNGYFAAAGIEIVEGRAFTDADHSDAERVVIIDEGLARRFWPQGGAVGGTVLYFNEDRDARIVGVARHARRYDLRADGRAQIYSPLPQRPVRAVELAVHSAAAPPAIARGLRELAAEVDARLVVGNERSMSEHVGAALSPWRFMLQILGLFAGAALALAALGVYGVVAVSVANRTREIGLRMALGARAVDVGAAVLGQAGRMVGAGLVVAALAALAVGRLMADFLYGVAVMDVPSFVAGAVVLTLVALVATWRPARRATRVAPAQTLQND